MFSESLSELQIGHLLYLKIPGRRSFRNLQRLQQSSKVSEIFPFSSPGFSNWPPGRPPGRCRRCGSAHRGAAPNAPPGVRQKKAAAGRIRLRSVRRRREAGVSYCCRSHKAGGTLPCAAAGAIPPLGPDPVAIAKAYTFPMLFLCFPYGWPRPMLGLCFPYAFPMLFRCVAYDSPMFFLWLAKAYAFPMLLLCFSYTFPMLFLCICYAFA